MDAGPAVKTHSLFGASQAARYLSCVGSTSLILALRKDGGEERRSSLAAATGTAKHHLVETCCRNGRDPESYRGSDIVADGFTFTVDDTFIAETTPCVEAVRSLARKGYELEFETKVTPPIRLSRPEMIPSGTADVIAFQPMLGRLVIIDYKFGKLPVEPVGNPQFRFYGVGALAMLYERGLSVRSVETWVIQPGIPHAEGPIRKTSMTPADLLDWAETVLQPGIEAAFTEGAPLTVGEHCIFCPAKLLCPAQKDHAQAVARVDFADFTDDTPLPAIPSPAQMSNVELARILRARAILIDWLECCADEARVRLEAGDRIPGWGLEPKRAIRKWTDPDAAYAQLIDAGFPRDVITKTELVSPTQLEKRSKGAYQAVEELVDATPSGVNLTRRARLTDGTE